MIIKSSRVLAHHGRAIARYFSDQGENERVSWLLGDALDIELMGLTAQLSGKLFGVRHIVIAPDQRLSQADLTTVLLEIFAEYEIPEISRKQACLVQHQKQRAGAGGCDTHYHFALPEFDLGTGRVLSSRFTKMRDEKLARMLELKLNHHPIVGRFNRQTYDAIEQENPTLDLAPFEFVLRSTSVAQALDEECWKDVKATAPKARAQWGNGAQSAPGFDMTSFR